MLTLAPLMNRSWTQSPSDDLCPSAMPHSPLCKPLRAYACTLSLRLPPCCCSGHAALGKTLRILLYSLQVEAFLFLFFGLVVSFGSTSTTRQTQFPVIVLLLGIVASIAK